MPTDDKEETSVSYFVNTLLPSITTANGYFNTLASGQISREYEDFTKLQDSRFPFAQLVAVERTDHHDEGGEGRLARTLESVGVTTTMHWHVAVIGDNPSTSIFRLAQDFKNVIRNSLTLGGNCLVCEFMGLEAVSGLSSRGRKLWTSIFTIRFVWSYDKSP